MFELTAQKRSEEQTQPFPAEAHRQLRPSALASARPRRPAAASAASLLLPAARRLEALLWAQHAVDLVDLAIGRELVLVAAGVAVRVAVRVPARAPVRSRKAVILGRRAGELLRRARLGVRLELLDEREQERERDEPEAVRAELARRVLAVRARAAAVAHAEAPRGPRALEPGEEVRARVLRALHVLEDPVLDVRAEHAAVRLHARDPVLAPPALGALGEDRPDHNLLLAQPRARDVRKRVRRADVAQLVQVPLEELDEPRGLGVRGVRAREEASHLREHALGDVVHERRRAVPELCPEQVLVRWKVEISVEKAERAVALVVLELVRVDDLRTLPILDRRRQVRWYRNLVYVRLTGLYGMSALGAP
jgi:hypothetical protein